MNLNYIILLLLGTLLMIMSFSMQNIHPWFSDTFSNIATGFYGSSIVYYLIERAQDKMQIERELPLKKSILFNIAKHLEVIIYIYMGLNLRSIFIEEDANKQFRKEIIGLKQVSNIIGFVTLPTDFLDKFLDLVAMIDTPNNFLSELPEYLKYEQELSIVKDIKELLEMMLNLEVDLPYIVIRNIIKKAEYTITRLEHEQPSAGSSACS